MSCSCYFWLFFCNLFVKFGIVSDHVCDFPIMFTTDECDHQHFSNPGFLGWMVIHKVCQIFCQFTVKEISVVYL